MKKILVVALLLVFAGSIGCKSQKLVLDANKDNKSESKNAVQSNRVKKDIFKKKNRALPVNRVSFEGSMGILLYDFEEDETQQETQADSLDFDFIKLL